MSELVQLQNQEFSLLPKNFEEAIKYAEMIAKSSFCPKSFQGKKEDVLIAIQMGKELDLKPLQALQNIAVINGRPSIWGDATLALVIKHPECEHVNETFDEETMKATCAVKRRGHPEHIVTFSKEDAIKAGLWSEDAKVKRFGKDGKPYEKDNDSPWFKYPKRMLQMRARGFALRDKFADALMGFITAEEAMDSPKEKEINQRPAFIQKNNKHKNQTQKSESKQDAKDAEQAHKEELNQPVSAEPEILATLATDDQIQTLITLAEDYYIEQKKVDDYIDCILRKANLKKITDLSAEKIDACIMALDKKIREKEGQ